MAAIRHGYGLIVVNAEVRGADLSHVLVASRLAFHADCVYRPSDSEQLFVDTADYLSFIGGVVIKRQVWMIRDRVSYFGTMFVHIAVIFQQALSEDSLVIVEPLISIRYGNALWTGRSFEISLFKWPNLIWSFPDYRSEAKALVTPKDSWRNWRTLLHYRARGCYSLLEYHRLLEPRLNSWFGRMVAKFVAVLPGHILNALFVLYLGAFRTQPRTRLVDLRSSRYYYRRWLRRPFQRIERGPGRPLSKQQGDT
jgi:hypothetical protein